MRLQLPKLTWKRVLTVVVVSIIVIMASFVSWAGTPSGVLMAEAEQALISASDVTVQQTGWIAFTPKQSTPKTGFIFYPGGRVQAEAYAPLAREIARAGYYVAIVYAPLNLAIFNPSVAQDVIDVNPQIEKWVVGGHSLGGVTAVLFAESNTQQVAGVVMIASFPASDALATRNDLRVLSIYGTADGLADPENVRNSAKDLPKNTRFVAIEGGNHAQFGWYGAQSGDNPATISHVQQLIQTSEAIVTLLSDLSQ